MKRYWAYLRALLRHKWYVFWAGIALGVPLHRLIFHDWDKFAPRMFHAYANAFFAQDGTGQYIESEEFELTWNRHQKVSRHHWQAHVLMEDSGAVKVKKMAYFDMLEMMSDWQGAGRAYGNPDTKGWYLKTLPYRRLHSKTQAWVEWYLDVTPEDKEQAKRKNDEIG